MTSKPGKDVRLRRIGQKLAIAAVLVLLIVGAASAQWGGWGWGNSSGGGWWSNQSQRRARPQRRAMPQYAPQQSYQPQQYYRYSQPAQQTRSRATDRSTSRQRTRSRRRPPVVAYGPEDGREARRTRSSSARASIRIRRSDESDSGGYGRISYCVRLCDGRYFQLSDPGRMKPEEICSKLCPASDTKVFSGSTIDDASAKNGMRYEKLKSAYLYRKELVQGCTCNGKNVFGLARIDLKLDPTLQAGDIVAMTDGLNVYNEKWSRGRGKRGRARAKLTPHFTPIKKSRLLSRSFRRTLNQIEIAKTRPKWKPKQQARQAEPEQPDLTD